MEHFKQENSSSSGEQTQETRLDLWRRKLLNLSLRNPLLNLKTGNCLQILCNDLEALKDKIAEEKDFTLLPMPTLTDSEGEGATIKERTGTKPDEKFIENAFKQHKLYIKDSKEKLDSKLVKLYRKARDNFQEGGANTLFLALGFLSWQRDDKQEQNYEAPLILVPVELKRKSVKSNMTLISPDDETCFNTTLLEMLHQDMAINITGLENNLPTEESGVNVLGILNQIQQEVQAMPGFEVSEKAVFAIFSFAKYLMWKDLVDRAEQLKENRVVKHLVESPKESYPHVYQFPEISQLDDKFAPSEIFAPFSFDSSQLSALIAAGLGKDFVINGPPGSGKSQTIANMIASLMGQGKKILFVAEKAGALNVVYRRLKGVGLEKFCLQLHSNKAKRYGKRRKNTTRNNRASHALQISGGRERNAGRFSSINIPFRNERRGV